MRKNDGSVSVHAGGLIPARNYLGSGAILVSGEIKDGDTLVFAKKSEKISIFIDKVITFSNLEDWSEDSVKLRRTEKELVLKVFNDWPDYFDIECFSIVREFKTEHGAIDILGTEFDQTKHVIEVKRRKATISDCGQVRRYVEVLQTDGFDVFGYLMAPDIGDKALIHLQNLGFKYINVEFGY